MPKPKLLTEPLEQPKTQANPTRMRTFYFLRTEDESGVSGTGIVAEGVEFTNGKVVINWLTKHRSLAIYENIKEAELIHGHGGKTKLVYDED